ncbi:hypothetical protein NDU88_002028 [Pleurodeles waltl]|uniref:Uncharacterized protein n=1 Tax=Pleurodeles waltl TaxID=8319 RepID=A0AAV7NE75_PLEWA|nr:hypothetical protein NDU88_002028 [Pleurodeles waltl]
MAASRLLRRPLLASFAAPGAECRSAPPPLLMGGSHHFSPRHQGLLGRGRFSGRTDHAAAPGATRGPSLSGRGRPQVRPGANRPILAPRASRIKVGGQVSGRPRSLRYPRMARFLVQILAAPPEPGDQACTISR